VLAAAAAAAVCAQYLTLLGARADVGLTPQTRTEMAVLPAVECDA